MYIYIGVNMYIVPLFFLIPVLRVLCEHCPFPRQRVLRVSKFLGGLSRSFLCRVELAPVLFLYMYALFTYRLGNHFAYYLAKLFFVYRHGFPFPMMRYRIWNRRLAPIDVYLERVSVFVDNLCPAF